MTTTRERPADMRIVDAWFWDFFWDRDLLPKPDQHPRWKVQDRMDRPGVPPGLRYVHLAYGYSPNPPVHLSVIVSGHRTEHGERWIHLSVSARKRIPTWEEFKEVKDLFLGDVLALQVLPPSAEFVNDNPFVLHLYHCVDRRPVPDFRINGTI